MKNVYTKRLAISLILFALMALGILWGLYPLKLFDAQFGPLAQKLIVDFSIISAVLFGGILLLTLIFGRFYCSIICPFGILQEILALILKKNEAKQRNLPYKYFILASTFGLLAGGSVFLLKIFDPCTLFGAGATLSLKGILALVFITFLVNFKNRFFCANICPVGALLGLFAKFAPFKIYFPDVCVSCGSCEKVCPTGSLDVKEKKADNETCIKCLKCLDACPKQGLAYGIEPKKEVEDDKNEKISSLRRKFIISGACAVVFGLMIKAGAFVKEKTLEGVQKIKEVILPPGAKNAESLVEKCLNCNLCVKNCPSKIIVKADKNFPAVHLDYTNGHCLKGCTICANVCPAGAIKRLGAEEKNKTRIAMAVIDEEKCAKCGLCASACQYGAISWEMGQAAVVAPEKCVGCGACKNACRFDAVQIYGVKEQKTI